MSEHTFGIALAAISLAMFAVNIVMTRYAMARLRLDVGFLIAVGVNVLFAAIAFAVESWLRTSPLVFDVRAFWLFVLSGVFTTYLGRWFFFETVARLGPARASTFQISSPMFTALVAWLFLGETLSPAVVLAMLAVIAGLYLAGQSPARSSTGRSNADTDPKHPRRGRLRRNASALIAGGFALGVGSAMAYAVGNVVRGAAIHRWQEPIAGALLGAISGIILHVMFSPASRRLVAEVRTADRRGVLLYASGGVLTISAQMLTIASMSYIPVSIAALITLCTPLIVVPVSHALFGREQPVTPRVYLGTAVALAGIAVIVLR
jgi:drug/metabolite transporter (DMT)-like permease